MANENNDLSTFPIRFEHQERYADGTKVTKIETHFGLTKLEYFTAAAMQGLLANSPDWSESEQSKKWVAVQAVEYATKTLEKLESLKA